jgi:WD40 repeat protein
MPNSFYTKFKDDITVKGPFWEAKVRVLNLEEKFGNKNLQHLTLRNLFVAHAGDSQNPKVMLPGTLLALCLVKQVTVTLSTVKADDLILDWNNEEITDDPKHLSLPVLTGHLNAGRLALLLLAADPKDQKWNPASSVPEFICVGGDINLKINDQEQDHQKFVDGLYRAIRVCPARPEAQRTGKDNENVGAAHLFGQIYVHSSGLTLYGQGLLPWQQKSEKGFFAPFQLAETLKHAETSPAIASFPGFRVTVEAERLTEVERQELARIWDELRTAFDFKAFPTDNRPNWASLEIVNEIPKFFWESIFREATEPRDFELTEQVLLCLKAKLNDDGVLITLRSLLNQPEATEADFAAKLKAALGDQNFQKFGELIKSYAENIFKTSFQTGSGEITLTVSDQSLLNPSNPPTSLARISMGITNIKPEVKNVLSISLSAGAGTKPVGTIPSLSYQAQRPFNSPKVESFTLSNARLAFDPVQTPQAIRTAQELPAPEWLRTENPQPVEPPVLWGFMPLEEGWAQLPVPNLTERMLDAKRAILNAQSPPPQSDEQPKSSPALLQGVVAFGNEQAEIMRERQGEQPWNLTLTNAASVDSTWTLKQAADKLELESIDIKFVEPQIILNGLFWLSTGKPTAADALPSLDDWLYGLYTVGLKSVNEQADIFAPVMLTTINQLMFEARPLSLKTGVKLAMAIIRDVELLYEANREEFQKLVDLRMLPEDTFGRHLPLIWRRHSSLPMIQALPLTQSQLPPNYPSPSRQLAPFELKLTKEGLPDDWKFGGKSDNVAAHWLSLKAGNPLAVASEWAQLSDLPLASLSLPGLMLTPAAGAVGLPDAKNFLPAQLRFDLPYLDEVNALAQLPKVKQPQGEVSPLPDPKSPPPAKPLKREDFLEYWQQLAEHASLASADAVEVLAKDENVADKFQVRQLIEPLQWTVFTESDLDKYPGTLSLKNYEDKADQKKPRLTLKKEEALRGITGSFVESDGAIRLQKDASPDAYNIVAGSMAAHASGTEFRDQRGLFRSGTTVGNKLSKTQVRFAADGKTSQVYQLTSALKATRLIFADGKEWALWFRDLPALGSGGQTTYTRLANPDLDINDPDALSRGRNFLSSYEWRLGKSNGTDFLQFFNLQFFPLRLEKVAFQDDLVTRVEITGRLQLPLEESDGAGSPAADSELDEFGNAVRLTFKDEAGTLALDEVSLDSEQCEWPLALASGEAADAPRLVWKKIVLTGDKKKISITDPRLNFILFDAEWSVKFTTPLTFEQSSIDQVTLGADLKPDSKNSLSPSKLELRLRPAQGNHDASLTLDVNLPGTRPNFNAQVSFPLMGQPAIARFKITQHTLDTLKSQGISQELIDKLATLKETEFKGEEDFLQAVKGKIGDVELQKRKAQLLKSAAVKVAPELKSYSLFQDLKLKLPDIPDEDDPAFIFTEYALQFRWKSYQTESAVKDVQVLPGMYLTMRKTPTGLFEGDAPGTASLIFSAEATPPNADGHVLPKLSLSAGFIEALFSSRWGEFLQAARIPKAPTLKQVFASSAGDLVFGYTAEFQRPQELSQTDDEQDWKQSFLLNGLLELKNLISWPKAILLDRKNKRLSLPAVRNTGVQPALDHIRHTARILFNQHHLPSSVLALAEDSKTDGRLLFDFQPNQSWQFLAVVEHQLIDVLDLSAGAEFGSMELQNDRRWTALQEVRLASPTIFEGLVKEPDKDADIISLREEDDPLQSIFGYFNNQFRKDPAQLTDGFGNKQTRMLLVEASAPHLIRQDKLSITDAATNLQFLPNGSQQATLSSPLDYAPSDPQSPRWLLLQTQFLGRLQNQERDGLDPATTDLKALNIDPLLRLKRLRQPLSTPLHTLSLAFSSWGHIKDMPGNDVQINVSGADWAVSRSLARLDAISLEENWFRLQHSLSEKQADGLQSVIASLPDTPARLSRSLSLRRAFDVFRPFYPPEGLKLYEPPPEIEEANLVWRQSSLMMLQGVSDSLNLKNSPPYPWHLTGLQITDSPLVQQGQINSVAVIPDGRWLLTGGKDATARLWDAKSGQSLAEPLTHYGSVNSVCFSLDGKFIATASDDKNVRVWKIENTTPVKLTLFRTIQHDFIVKAVAFSPNGTELATASNERFAHVWNFQTGTQIHKLQHDEQHLINAIAYSPNGQFLATAPTSETVRVWQLSDDTKPLVRLNHKSDTEVIALAFDPSGKFLVTASTDGKVTVWDWNSEKEPNQDDQQVNQMGSVVNAIAFSRDSKLIALGQNDSVARVFEWSNIGIGHIKPEVAKHKLPITSVAFDTDGTHLAVGSLDCTAKVWPLTGGAAPVIIRHEPLSAEPQRHAAATLLPSQLRMAVTLFSSDLSQPEDNATTVPDQWRAEFGRHGIILSKELTVEHQANDFLITDEEDSPPRTYILRRTLGERTLVLEKSDNPLPLSFAVSPYLSLEFQPVLTESKYLLSLVAAELVCLDPATGALRPVAEHFDDLLVELQQTPTVIDRVLKGIDVDASVREKIKKLLLKGEVGKLKAELLQEKLKTLVAAINSATTTGYRSSILNWARESHQRLCPNSPVAALRFREVNRNILDTNGTEPPLSTTYSFAIVPGIQPVRHLARRAFSIRTKVGALRFREGQFGGQDVPLNDLRSFELAPPQVTGVQPLYLLKRPLTLFVLTDDSLVRLQAAGVPGTVVDKLKVFLNREFAEKKVFLDELKKELGEQQAAQFSEQILKAVVATHKPWPWGSSSIRVSVEYVKDKPKQEGEKTIQNPIGGVVGDYLREEKDEHGASKEITLWWQAIQHLAQFRAGTSAPAAGLPHKFRAQAIKSFLPKLPHLLLPELEQLIPEEEFAETDLFKVWQAMLPSALRYLITGARPGVMFAAHHFLLRQKGRRASLPSQEGASVLSSGSLPIQHRMPRPVPLPANQAGQRATALQTWASHFEPETNLAVSIVPADEALFIESLNQQDVHKRLKLMLKPYEQRLDIATTVTQLEHGSVSTDWTGELHFDFRRDTENKPDDKWQVKCELIAGAQTLTYPTVIEVENVDIAKGIIFQLDDAEKTRLKQYLAKGKPGDVLYAIASVMPIDSNKQSGFNQKLPFPIRLFSRTAQPLPLRPRFLHFEDPEYNRRLSSASAHASRIVKFSGEGGRASVHTATLSTDRTEYNFDSQLSLRYDWDDPCVLSTVTLQLFRIDTSNVPREVTCGELEPTPENKIMLFELTQESLSRLAKAEVPADSLTKLKKLLGIPYQQKERLLDEITKSIGAEQATKFAQALSDSIMTREAAGYQNQRLVQLPLGSLRLKSTNESLRLQPGDTLQLKLKILSPSGTAPGSACDNFKESVADPTDLFLSVKIIEEPVIPVPEAGYALLRAAQASAEAVECSRFAWSPQASRIELINPEDLRQEIVRRRAVFNWTDSVRPVITDAKENGQLPRYALQKITQTGSTHFPY